MSRSRPRPPGSSSRLQAAGVRPINNVVDVTNYVLLELGQPMHAFDLEKLAGREIRIRRAMKGERIKTLDGVDRSLDPEMLVIADADKAQAVAGVMGGGLSEVSSATKTIVLESAFFDPRSVRRTSKKLGLKTEASARFERGADVNAALEGIERAIALLEEIGAGTARGGAIDAYPAPVAPRKIELRHARIGRMLGLEIPESDVERILKGLGFEIRRTSAGWDVAAPTFRVDVLREIDLIEEVARHYGYDRLPAAFPPLSAPPGPSDPRIERDRLVRRVLLAAGCSEALTFSFIDAGAAAPFADERAIVPIGNPLSAQFSVLRPSLLPGLLASVAHNRHRERADVRLFELGACMTRAGESRRVAVALTGAGGSATGVPRIGPLISSTSKGSSRPSPARCRSASRSTRRHCPPISSAAARRPSPSAAAPSAASACWPLPSWRRLGCRRRKTSTSPSSTSTRWRPRDRRAADGEAAAPLSVHRSRHLDRRRRDLARGNGSWHYPCGRAGDACVGARVRSVSRQGRAGRARQPLASPHVPLARADADGCGSRDGHEKDSRCAERCASRDTEVA